MSDKLQSLLPTTKKFVEEHVSKNLYEFCGCALLALVSHNTAVGSWQYAMAFTVVYLLNKTQKESVHFHGNPAFTFSSWLTGFDKALDACAVIKQVLFQIFGYAFGYWFGGIIGLTAHVASDTPSDFAPMVFNEVISVGIMAWLYMHIHDNDKTWEAFEGFAVGVAIWFGYQLKLGGAHLNAAIFAGEDFGKSIAAWNAPSWGLNDFVLFFAPLVSVFITTLVYKFYHK